MEPKKTRFISPAQKKKFQEDEEKYSNLKFDLKSLYRMIKKIRERDLTIEKMFELADTSGDGVLDIMEMKQCLTEIGGFSGKELHAITTYLDIDKDGNIDKNEFFT